MWEAIESNRRRSWLLIGLLGAVLVGLGFVAGLAIAPEGGGAVGAIAALALWLAAWSVTVLGGGDLLLFGASAREVRKDDAPRLFNVVEEMTIASGLGGSMPRVFVVDSDAPNAFAIGFSPDKAAIAVTSGLVKRLDRDELQGVIAHEIGHILNRDARFMTLAAVMLGSIAFVADAFFRVLWHGGAGRRRSSKGGGQAQILILAIAVVAAILAPIAARLLFFACSRRREYLADACAARFTRYPEGLASALEKIALAPPPGSAINRAIAPLCIVNPLQDRAASSLFSSHPPTEERIRILRSMAGGAGYVDYERAFKKVRGGGETCIGPRSLAAGASIRERPAAAEDRADAVERAREIAAALGRLAELLPIACACGVWIQLPPGLARPSVRCPRCGTEHELPRAAATPAAASLAGAAAARYVRRTPGWETFQCPCGKVQQIGPAFIAPSVRCRSCGRDIEIVAAVGAPAEPRAPAG